MRKMFGVIVVLLIMYVTFQVVYSFVVGQKVTTYEIKVDNIAYQVKEKFTSRYKTVDQKANDVANYYYEISVDDKMLFSFKLINSNYKGVKEYLQNLMIYKENDLICAYPVFKEKNEMLDVMCNEKDNYYLYGTVRGKNKNLDNFVDSLKNLGYQQGSWDEPNLQTKKVGNFSIYAANMKENQNLSIWQYKGFYRVTNRGEKFFTLNTLDKYEPTLTTMVNQYYVVPNYEEPHSFNRMYITNLITGKIESFDLGVNIPYDSFIQGVVEDKIYLIDRSSKIQYAIDIYKKQTTKTGDVNNGSKYYNEEKWETKSIYDVIDGKLKFTIKPTVVPESLKEYNPLRVDEVGGDTDGYYYLYIKNKNEINVYRVDKQNLNVLTLIFKTPTVNSPKYVGEDIYFVSSDTLYYYRYDQGLKPIIKYSEFVFNQSNLYNVYVSD